MMKIDLLGGWGMGSPDKFIKDKKFGDIFLLRLEETELP